MCKEFFGIPEDSSPTKHTWGNNHKAAPTGKGEDKQAGHRRQSYVPQQQRCCILAFYTAQNRHNKEDLSTIPAAPHEEGLRSSGERALVVGRTEPCPRDVRGPSSGRQKGNLGREGEKQNEKTKTEHHSQHRDVKILSTKRYPPSVPAHGEGGEKLGVRASKNSGFTL